MAQETFEQTQRRLGLVPGAVIAPANGGAPRPPRMNGRGVLRTGVTLGVVALAGIVGYSVFTAQPAGSLVEDEWTAYPGSAFVESDDILAQHSLEQTQADSDAMATEIQDALAEYGFAWTTSSDDNVFAASNGYGGTSMLFHFDSASRIGAVQLQDPGARQHIVDIFADVIAGHEGMVSYVQNDETDDDAEYYFGSDNRDEQALWTAHGFEEDFGGLQVSLDVYDATVPVGNDFGGAYWLPESATGSLFVSIEIFASDLLADGDREAFIAALEPYEGQVKPPYRG